MDELKLNEFIKQPNKYFSSPKEILKSKELSHKQKKAILMSWKSQCVSLSTSTFEGMISDNTRQRVNLSDVVSALDVVNS